MMHDVVAREYARVLSRVASEEAGDLQVFFRELGANAAAMGDFRNFMNHPAITVEEKLDRLAALSRKPLGPVVVRVVADILRRRQSHLFTAVADEMEALADEARNIRTVLISSARPLSDGMQKVLIDKLTTYTRGGVKARFFVDNSLLSGLLIKIGDIIIDNSIKTDLDRLRRELMTVSST
ncbi:MAG: ATP synthase F1 subunit delta [Chitinispirillaceae bacterium]|nr:ATP synthase F1 subunit delta [Chitinispirillaceae bacterium]